MAKLNLKLSGILLIAITAFILLGNYGYSQRPRVSPMAGVSQTLGEATEVIVTYSRPAVKGRTIWGDLVPFDKVWRTGANEATTISFTDDVLIEGKELKAGKYALFTIPAQKAWTLIFNKQSDQWGAFKYNPGQDALQITVKPETSADREWMQFHFEKLNGTSANAVLQWDKLQVPFKIETQKKDGEVRASLKAEVSQTIGAATKISVVYSRPGVRGREIWGGLVPYDKIWRTGANENTTITFSEDVMVEGKKLAAGTYGLHTIPSAEEWTIIFNNNSTAWGSFDYNKEEDALRVTVKPQSTDTQTEWLTFFIDGMETDSNNVPNKAKVRLVWNKLEVPILVALL